MLEAVHMDIASPSAWSTAPKISSHLRAGRQITASFLSVATELTRRIIW